MRIFRKILLFLLGGGLYTLLELLWRGRSHSSMFILGGLCFLLLGKLRKIRPPFQVPRCVVGAGIITVMEFAAGLLVNRQHQIWNYCDLLFNLLGQICLPFTLLWIPIASLGMGLYGRLSQVLDQSTTSL